MSRFGTIHVEYAGSVGETAIDLDPEVTESAVAMHEGTSERDDAAAAVLSGDLAVSVWDRSGGRFVPVWVNEAFTALTGYTLADAVAAGETILKAGSRAAVVELIDENCQSSGRFQMALPIVAADGEEMAVPVAITSQCDAAGRAWRIVAAQREVAESVSSPPVILEHQSRRALELVAKVSEILSEIDDGQVLAAIARLVSRRLDVWCTFVVDDGVLRVADGVTGLKRHSVHHAGRGHTPADTDDPVAQALAGVLAGPVHVDLDAAHIAGTRTAQISDLVRDQLPAARGRVNVLPLYGRSQPLGLMIAVPGDGAEKLENLGTVLELVARRVGMAMDNAYLHHSEHALAETLQRAMLPELDNVDGLDVWTYYAPSSEHAQVGGDWYDVVRLDDGVVVLVIGDVAGHDIEAAAAMGQLRSVVRAFAAELPDPGDVLSRVDRIVDSMRIARVASMIYATLTEEADHPGRWSLRYTRAGHLPGLLLRDGQIHELDGGGGRLVGFGEADRETAEVGVEPGDVLVLYTDGLVERRDRPVQRGVEDLQQVLTSTDAPDAASVGELLLRELAEDPEDDVALVVVRVPDPSTPTRMSGRTRRWRFPAVTESVRSARQATVTTCTGWGIAEAGAAELVVSELVANAVMHGWGVVTLTLGDTGDGLRVEVEDDNPMPPLPLETHPARVGGYGMHIVSRLAEWGWRPSGVGKVVWARIGADGGPDGGVGLPGAAGPDPGTAEA